MRLILASASPRRLDLLARIGVIPDEVVPADIDESVPTGELPRDHALRLAREKAAAIAARASERLWFWPPTRSLPSGAAFCPRSRMKRRFARACKLLSGRRHRVLTGVALAGPAGRFAQRLGETMIAMKRLSDDEIDYYASHGEWHGKAGGYALQGYGEVYVRQIAGSYSECRRPSARRDTAAAEVGGISNCLNGSSSAGSVRPARYGSMPVRSSKPASFSKASNRPGQFLRVG